MDRERIYKLLISYDGTLFKGWQLQGDLATVQLEMEKAVAKCWGKRYGVYASGRTDTGVHALGQVAHIKAPAKFDPPTLLRALNYHLPLSIRVLQIKFAASDFHARFSARGKEYLYRVVNSPIFSPFEINRAHHMPRPLDLKAMRQACMYLVGEHDFASFTSNPGYARKSTVRRIDSIKIQKKGNLLTFRFHGNGFLFRMVRNTMGILLRVGLGELESQEVQRILAARKRSAAYNTAPACGLYLNRVFYGRSQKPTQPAQEDE